MGALKKPKNPKLFSIGVGTMMLGVAIGIGALLSIDHRPSVDHSQTPQFQAVLPAGSSINTLGGWNRLSPPGSDPFYVFTDTLEGVSINVSQQPLPQAFRDDPATKVAELAKGYNATKSILVGDIRVYIGSSAKGPQSLIFTKNELLLLIKSQGAIETDAWKRYIESLQ